jgi:hypothetical protein
MTTIADESEPSTDARVLAIESTEALSHDDILRSLSWAQLDEVVFMDHVPVDKRHNAKVDYIALFRKL